MLIYPQISPIFFQIGPLALRWYGLAYVVGISLGLGYAHRKLKNFGFSLDDSLNLATWITAGILIGGRLGYVLVYDLSYYLQNPLESLAFWHGGMAYHGGALGCLLACLSYCKWAKKSPWHTLDQLGIASTFGLFFGRIANFINGELYGRTTTSALGMVFPNAGPSARHPSQLYEAFGEGVLLFILLWVLSRLFKLKPGQLFACYLMGYGTVRFGVEFFREPDPQLGTLWTGLTMGQTLCTGMVIIGLLFFIFNYSWRKHIEKFFRFHPVNASVKPTEHLLDQ